MREGAGAAAAISRGVASSSRDSSTGDLREALLAAQNEQAAVIAALVGPPAAEAAALAAPPTAEAAGGSHAVLSGLTGAAFAVAFLLMLALPVLLRPLGTHHVPECRKSAAVAVAEGDGALLVWSGMGHGLRVFDDLHSFDLQSKRWSAVRPHSRHHSRKASRSELSSAQAPLLPGARWKAAVAQLADGMLVVGGDEQEAGRATYPDDTWLLQQPGPAWVRAHYKGPGPGGRRAHSAVTYKDAAGRDAVLIFGGKQRHGKLADDVWTSSLKGFPNVTWEQLWPPAGDAGADGRPGPAARKGHTAVTVPLAGGGQGMLVFGGRNEELGYFGDLWLFDPSTRRWEEVVTQGDSPAPRDHHGAAYFNGAMFLFGGRTGETYSSSQPVGDRWVLQLDADPPYWRQLPMGAGLTPLPRFLYSFTQYKPQLGADQFVVFGGETHHGCKLNDVWSLDLATLKFVQLSHPEFCKRRCSRVFGGS